MSHIAACQCDAVRVEFASDPDFAIACNCKACQRRTGSAFGVGTYFKKADLKTEDTFHHWDRTAESGRGIRNFFCPSCGTTVYWSLEMRPEYLGVALGCLRTDVAEPIRAIWMQEKLDCVSFPDHWPTFGQSTG